MSDAKINPQLRCARPDPFSLTGKVALITGASKGIGLEIAREFGVAGARGVVLVARSASALEEAREVVARSGTEVLVLGGDVTDAESVRRAVGSAFDKFGEVDVLVNNAGGAPFKAPMHEIRDDGWRKMIDLNLSSAYRVSSALIENWTDVCDGRSIINIGSTAAVRAWPRLSYYAAAKHGLVGLTKTMARELGPSRIRVNLLCPGLIRTDLTGGVDEVASSDQIPLGRWGTSAEVAQVARFLASDASSYVSGAVLTVDGGYAC